MHYLFCCFYSSGLWPFSTVGWPHAVQNPDEFPSKAQEFSRYYPGNVLETGYDILFFWVARMVTMGLELTNQLPFHTIYLHGLIRDAQGQKMSKTKGNVIDPIDTISSFGSDALRYTLVTSSTPGQDVSLAMEKIEFNRNFVNKLWNIGKYIDHCTTQLVQKHYDGDRSRLQDALKAHSIVDELRSDSQRWNHLHLSERYILSQHHELIKEVNEMLSNYQFAESGKAISEFLWNELADWYIEVSKTHLRAGTIEQQVRTLSILYYIWDHSLRLLHPYMPYVTEILYQQIPHHQRIPKHESIMIAPFPQPQSSPDSKLANAHLCVSSTGDLITDSIAVKTFQKFQEIIKQIRNLRAEYNVDVNKKLPIILKVNSQPDINSQASMLKSLLLEKAGLGLLCKVDDENISVLLPNELAEESTIQSMKGVNIRSESTIHSTSNKLIHLIIDEDIELYIPQSELIDKEKERQRLKKQLEKLQKDIDGLENRLSNDSFRLKAPESLVMDTQAKLQDSLQQKAAIERSINQLHSA
jgi:valyl-tRNA synthetase